MTCCFSTTVATPTARRPRSAFEAAKKAGKAKHIGVSNFNTYDLSTLALTATQPIEVLEAHFGVGLMDWEVMEYAQTHNIHPVSFSSLSESLTDLPNLEVNVAKVAAAHNITADAVMYAYVAAKNITVLSTYDPSHPEWLAEDIGIFNVKLSGKEMLSLDSITPGKRTRQCTPVHQPEHGPCAGAGGQRSNAGHSLRSPPSARSYRVHERMKLSLVF